MGKKKHHLSALKWRFSENQVVFMLPSLRLSFNLDLTIFGFLD